MYLEIEIDHNRGTNKKLVTLKVEEESDRIKMKFDRRPDFDIPEFRLLKRRRAKEQKKSDGSASFLRAARAGNLEKVLEFLKTNTDINTCNANGLNALHLASKEGHVHVVTELLQRGASVDAATKKGNTALHIASLAGQEEIVKVLVQHQALVNIQSQNGFTPLYMAAQENHDNVVRFLLANNANQSLATEDGFTPLAVALQQGHDKVVAVLLENDTRGKVRLPALHIAAKKDDTKAAALLLHTDHNPDVTSKSGFTPLHIAAHYGNENIANLLIQRGADVNYIAKHQITPLHVASKWGKGNMVSLLIDKGANYEAKTRDGLTPLHCAARSGHETVVDMLLEKGAPITSKTKNGLAPLHMASQGDHVDAARILLYHKAPVDDVTVDYLTALHVAAHCGHVRVAKLLLDRKADPNSRALNGFTPLHIACKKNRIKVVELLLKHGASIEATTESGLTPLHVASFMGCMNIVIYLIQHGASADVPTVRGETPLHLAARANQTDIIRILLRNGAQVDARAREQQTALHIASRLGNSDIVVLLLQHGAAVDATTKDHYTALHIAAKEGQEEVASVLLEHGASLTSTTKKGFTPLHLAAKYGNMKVARLLLQKDAPVDAQGKNGVTPLHVAAHYDHQNVALLLLDKTASPHATAKNGYTPLHIAARKNQMDIATTLLEFGASANAESKAGFTPLHLSSQEGHTDMATLLIEHNASPGACAKNGLTPLHLCAQEDRVNVAAILVKHGAQIDPVTKAGYTPLHVASHFGQMNMVRFLLQHGAKVDSTTQLGYTPLHQAAQQGHTQIVNLLLENKAEPNAETNDGKTALSIAQRLGYISVVETLKIVTETTITTTTTTVTEEKYKVVVPETMHETFMSESEDEGGDDNLVSSMFGKQQHVTLPYYEGQFRYTSDDTMLGDQSYRYLTVDEMKSLGDDSLPIDVTKDEKMDVSFISNSMAAPPVAPADQLSPQHQKEQQYAQFTASYPSDNVDIAKTPILAGVSLNSLASCLSAGTNTSGMWRDRFLVSFMVDARGGAMRGCRHSGVRVIIPPRKAAMPMRITCRYLKKDKLVHAPPLMEGEALASRILEMGPAGAKFLGPVIIEVPHFASLRGKEREIVILRSDNGETWREHTLEATEEAVQEVLNESFDGEELKQLEDLNTNRITRILTTDFPQYFAIVTRIRQEVHAIGPEGGMVSSTVVPQVQAVFPQGALTKKIKVGLQAQPIPTDLVAKLLGNRVAVSPIVTVEPRRRKFHKPITLTIPVPQAASKGMINQYSGEAPTLRLLCSITGGTTRAQWEDVTGSTPLTFVNDCVSFTTTVSARFWLMDCSNIPEATKMATELYREAIHVPFMAKFVVFSKRHQLEEARVRVFCMTDDREDKTLENQEMFVEVAKSRDVEVLEGKPQFLEFAGNLVPVTKSGDQLAFNFYAFRENRLPFTVRVKDQHADCIGRVAFMRQPKVGRGDPPQTPICNLNIALPDNIQPEPAPSEPDLLALEKKYSFLSISKADTIHKADLRLTDISNMLGTDWVGLARELEISDSDINIIKSQYPDNAPQQAIVMLRLWMQTSGNKANGNTLEKGLRKIGRDDIVNQCIFNVELVTDDIERAMAKAHLDQSGFEAFREELGPSRDATLNRDISLDVSYDEQDMMKEAESAEEEEENQRTYQEKTSREQRAPDMSPTYESEEKKYAGEEKIVAEDKVTKVMKDEPTVIATTTIVEQPDVQSKKEAVIAEVKKDVIEEKAPAVVEPTEKMKEQMAEKVEERVLEEKVEEKPIVDIEKHVEVVDKLQESKLRLDEKAPEALPPSKMPEDKTVTTTKVVEGPDGTISTTTTITTERRSFVTSDDGAVQEDIIIEKRTAKVADGMTAEEDKSDILQRLGEELGRLDEKLEEKFKEKRKTEEPEEGFTQTSVEKSQMSSTRGTADVSTAGTTITTGQLVGDTILQAGPVLTPQMSPQPVDRRLAQQVALSHAKQDHRQVFSKVTTNEEEKYGRTEERGCSPITVLEGRAAEGDNIPIRPLSRSGAHTITTTTSWGAPVSTTTSIQVDDSKTDNCVQLTLHSESHVTLHAPGEIWGEFPKVKQEEHLEDPCMIVSSRDPVVFTDEDSNIIYSGKMLEAVEYDSDESIKGKEYQKEVMKSISGIQSHQNECEEDISGGSSNQQIPSNIDYRDLAVSALRKVETSMLSDRTLVSRGETETLRVEETPPLITTVDKCMIHDSADKFSTVASLSPECEEIHLMQSSLVEELHAVCDNSLVLSEDYVYVANESLAPSAHRPTTLMITSNSNESTDDAECITNDPTKNGGENEKSQDLKRDTCTEGMEMTVHLQGAGTGHVAVGNEQLLSEGGAIPRPERPSRPAPRTTTLVKVKVEKRPVGSHSQVRERSHESQPVLHVPSVEEEVRGLMQEVKEATSQIKQEVKELRQADTPTPDTPTPLREFREFLNREEEQEQERLPTIKEMCRESEEDASLNAGGEISRGSEHLRLDLSLSVSDRTTSAQFIHQGFDENIHPDSGYSTLEGYYAQGTDPSTTKYIPSCSEPVPEGSPSEPFNKFELEGPSSFVDSSDLSPVEFVCSATLPGNGSQGKSKFKSFMQRVHQLTAKSHCKLENMAGVCQGVEPQAKDISRKDLSHKNIMEGTWDTCSQEKFTVNQPPQRSTNISINLGETSDYSSVVEISQEKGNGRLGTLGFGKHLSDDKHEEKFISSSPIVSDDVTEEFGFVQDQHIHFYSQSDIHSEKDNESIPVINKSESANERTSVPIIKKTEFYAGVDCTSTEDFKLENEFSGVESLVVGSSLVDSPHSESSPTGSQYTESLITEPSTSDHSPEGVTFEMDSEQKKSEVEEKKSIYEFRIDERFLCENTIKPEYRELEDHTNIGNTDMVLSPEPSQETGRHLMVSSSSVYREKDDFDMCHKESSKPLETLIEEDEMEDDEIHLDKYKFNTSHATPVQEAVNSGDLYGDISKVFSGDNLQGTSKTKATLVSVVNKESEYPYMNVKTPQPSSLPKMSCSLVEDAKAKFKGQTLEEKDRYNNAEHLELNIKQSVKIGTETLHQVYLLEDIEDTQEVKEFSVSSPNYVTLTTSVYQPEYLKKIKISHKILGSPFSRKFSQNHDVIGKTEVVCTGSIAQDMDFVHVTETASYVNDMEIEDNFDIASKIHPEIMKPETVSCLIHSNSELDTAIAVAIQSKPLCPQYDQIRAQIPMEGLKADELIAVNVPFEKGHSLAHPDFQTATISEERINLPITIEKAVQSQEIKIPICKAEAMLVSSNITTGEAQKFIDTGCDISDFGVVEVKRVTIHHPNDIEKAAQIQETKEYIEKTGGLSLPHIKAEKVLPNVHESLVVASCLAPPVSHKYDVAKVLKPQEIHEEVDKIDELVLPYVNDDHSCLTTCDDFDVACIKEITTSHAHNIAKPVEIQAEKVEEVTEEKHHKCSKEEYMKVHSDSDLHEFCEILVSKPEMSTCNSLYMGRHCVANEKYEISKDLPLPVVPREKAGINLHQQKTSDLDIAVISKGDVIHCCDIQRTLHSHLFTENLESKAKTSFDKQQRKAELSVHKDPDCFKFAVVNTKRIHQPNETQRNIQAQTIKEEIGTTEEIILPKPQLQKAKLTEHGKSHDFSVAATTKDKVTHSYETERIAQSQVAKEELVIIGSLTIPVIKVQNGKATEHKASGEFIRALVKSHEVYPPHEIIRIAQPLMVREKMDAVDDISLPEVYTENLKPSVHKEGKDFIFPTVREVSVCQPYETQRIGKLQVAQEDMGITEDLAVSDVRLERAIETDHKGPNKFDRALLRESKVGKIYDIQRCVQPQISVENLERTCDLIIPSVAQENIQLTDQKVFSELNVAISRKDVVSQAYETQKIVQPQVAEEEIGIIEEVILPYFSHEKAVTAFHPQSKETAVALSKKNEVNQPYESQRMAQPQVTTEDTYTARRLVLQNFPCEKALSTSHPEFCDHDTAFIGMTLVHKPYEIQHIIQPQIADERSEAAENLTLPDFQLERAVPLDHTQCIDFSVALSEKAQVSHPCETERVVQPQIAWEECRTTEDTVLPSVELEKAQIVHHKKPKDCGVLAKKGKVIQQYHTERTMLLQTVPEQLGMIEDMTVTDVKIENAVVLDHKKSSDFGVAVIRKDKVSLPHETQKVVYPRMTSEEVETAEKILLHNVPEEKAVSSRHNLTDFDIAVAKKDKVIQPYQIERTVHPQTAYEEMEVIENMVSADVKLEKGVYIDHKEFRDSIVAKVEKDGVSNPYDIQRVVQPHITTEGVEMTRTIASPEFKFEKAITSRHSEFKDSGSVSVRKDESSKPYEIHRRVEPKVDIKDLETTGVVGLSDTKFEMAMASEHKDSRDFGFALDTKVKVIQAFETSQNVQPQYATADMMTTKEIVLPDVHKEKATTSEHVDHKDFGITLSRKEKISQPFETQRVAQLQVAEEKMLTTTDITLQSTLCEKVTSSAYTDSKDLGTALLRKDDIHHPHRAVQLQLTTEEMGSVSNLIEPVLQLAEAMTADHKESEDYDIALLNESKVYHPYETLRNVQAQTAQEDIGTTEELTLPEVKHEKAVTVDQQESKIFDAVDVRKIFQTQRTAEYQISMEKGEAVEDVTLSDIQFENAFRYIQTDSKELNFSVPKRENVGQPPEILQLAKPIVAIEEISTIGDLTLPGVQFEKGVKTNHEESDEYGIAVLGTETVNQPYETWRIALPKFIPEGMSVTELPLQDVQFDKSVPSDHDSREARSEKALSTDHQECKDFDVAVIKKEMVKEMFNAHTKTGSHFVTKEVSTSKDEVLPNIPYKHLSCDRHDPRDLDVAVARKDKVNEPYETKRIVQPCIITEEMRTTSNITLPDVELDQGKSEIHMDSGDLDIATVRQVDVAQSCEIERYIQQAPATECIETASNMVDFPHAQPEKGVTVDHYEYQEFGDTSVRVDKAQTVVLPQTTAGEVNTTKDMALPIIHHERGVKSECLETKDLDVAIVCKDQVSELHETQSVLQPRVPPEEVITGGEAAFQVVKHEKGRSVGHGESQDFCVAEVGNDALSILSDSERERDQVEYKVLPCVHLEQVLTTKYEEFKDFSTTVPEKDQAGYSLETQSAIQSLIISTESDGKIEEFAPPTHVYEKCLETTHQGEELLGFKASTQLLGFDVSTVFTETLNVEGGTNRTAPTREIKLCGVESHLKEGVTSVWSLNSEENRLATDVVSDENNISKNLIREEHDLYESIGDVDQCPITKGMDLNICESEEELPTILNKQMEELVKDEEDTKENRILMSGLYDKESAARAKVLSKPMFSGSCDKPEGDSSESFVAASDTEKIVILDRVSDELRHMISNLEYNLATGISKNIKITPILARLEQLEQEVATIAKSSETVESSIPFKYDVIKNDSVVSYSQTELLEKGAESSCEPRNLEDTTHITTMPVVVGKEPANLTLPGGPSPTGETNGVDVPEALTDVEDLLSDGDQSPLVKRKVNLIVPQKDTGAITDTEDMDLSGEEDEYIQDKKDLPTIQDLGLLPEPTRELVNLTEGFLRQPSPLLSGSESDVEDVEGRHKKNLKKMETLTESETLAGEPQIPGDTEPEGLTDEENVDASGDEIEEATEAAEDSLPEHYLDQGDGISNKEKINACVPKPKVFHSHYEESSDEEQYHKQKPKRKTKGGLKVEVNEEGTTDVEDLVVSDKGGDTTTKKEKTTCAKIETKDKPRKKKQVCRKVVKKPVISKNLMTPTGDAEGLTDVEILTGDDEDEIEEDESYLAIPGDGDDALTDCEDVEASDTEDVETFIAKPIQKLEPATLPPPHAEKIKISETEEEGHVTGDDTDEEGFELEDKVDEKPLIPRKKVSYEPIVTVEKETLEVEEPCEPALTDTEDFDMDDKEEEEIFTDFASRIPEEGEIYTLKEMEGHLGHITKTEMIKDVDAELKQKIKDAEKEGLSLQEALNDDTHTDVEDLDEDEKPSKPKAKQRKENETDEESVTESDIEEEIPKPTKQGKRKGRRLPLAPQISEVRFIETEQGPLSIIITPDTLENKPERILKDQVANVVFLEKDEMECTTDVEDLGLSDEEGGFKHDLKAPDSSHEPTTDTEDLDIDPSDLDRPLSPLPPNVERNLFSSPKRELIQIKEDKYGVPQVTIRKLEKDELLVSDLEDAGLTDTEDIEVTEGEALRIVGVTEDDTSDFELPDSGKVEVSSKVLQKEVLQVEPDEEGGSTDIEELPMTRKQRRKPKTQSKLIAKVQEDSHTDVELLSDQDDKINLKIRTETPDAHTDMEDIETSETEELDIPSHENAATPDIITNSAIRKVVTLKEGPDGTVQTEESEVAPPRKNLLHVEDELEGVTDVEDMEASGAEDEDLVLKHPPVELPEYDGSNVNISEKSNLPKSSNEAKHIKDNLLLPEDNYNNLTDVESLSEGEGNRCASNTNLLSSQQLTYAVENCTVAELSYYLPTTDPKLCVHPGVSLESDPYCGELTSPLVVEAELEQVYYHAPKEDAHKSEVELEASDGCVVRKRQVVASMCQAREIRRFWSLDRNSPLNQAEINAFAAPTIHKKGFKTILYLEQPNLLDTISISDTLCDSGYFRNERILDFDSSSIDSFDDHFSYRDSDIVTVVDQFNQERGSSFDDLPSPHLSSISSTGIVDSLCSGKSFSSDHQCSGSPQSPLLLSSYSKCSSEDFKKESELTLSLSGISALSCSPDVSLLQEAELSSLDVEADKKNLGEINLVSKDNDRAQSLKPTDTFCISSGLCKVDKSQSPGSAEESEFSPVIAHPVSEILRGLAVECHEGFTTECVHEYASKNDEILAKETTENTQLENSNSYKTDCVKGFATEYIENPPTELVDELVPEYKEIEAALCIRNSPTGFVQRSITEWIVGQNIGQEDKKPDLDGCMEPSKTFSQLPALHYDDHVGLGNSKDRTTESVNEHTLLWLKSPQELYQMNVNAYSEAESDFSADYKTELRQLNSSSNIDSSIRVSGLSSNIDSSVRVSGLSSEYSHIPFEDSGVHEYYLSGSFTSSDKLNKTNKTGYESDHISLADSVLSLDNPLDRDLVDVEGNALTYISAQFSSASQVPKQYIEGEKNLKKQSEGKTLDPVAVVPLTWRHTLPRTISQVKSEKANGTGKILGNIAKDFEEISKDFTGVKGLIDQWEVIVKEEQMRSLPSSPAVGRKILPPFDGTGSKKANAGNLDELRNVAEDSHTTDFVQTTLISKSKDVDSFDGGGGNVIEEVASVCDIIQKFEGRVGRLGKMNSHRQRLRRRSQSPTSRSPSHHRRVATVKPLCEPQLQVESSSPLQEGQIQQHHQEQGQELLEHTVSAGFVPRVVESLSVTKCSNDIWEESPPQASVSNPEGTHEATHITEQQPTSLSHDQGLDVEEMSNIMESYTSEGSDLITTTTHTTTSIDPDPITSTQITRITRRTEIKDGEIKEDVYEEY